MMQAAESWHRYNPAIHIGPPPRFTTCGRLLRQRKTGSVLVIVTDVLLHQASQMPFIHNNHMVEQIPRQLLDPTFRNPVLPRTLKLVRFGWIPKLFKVSMTSLLKFC